MAEHADASHEELSEADRAETSSASPSNSDEASSESTNKVTTNEDSAEAAPASEEEVTDAEAEEAEDYDAMVDGEVDDNSKDAGLAKKPRSPVRLATVWGLVVVAALAAVAGWFGFRGYQSHQSQEQRELLVQVGRQGALNLTTIDWQHADADVQRILDSATGTFYDDFSKRSRPFVDVVKKAQSKSVGTVTAAGLESRSGDEAQVLVAVSVNTSNLGAAEQEPRHWRMRISVQKVGNDEKISNVEFVP